MDKNPPKFEWNYYTAEVSDTWDLVKYGRDHFNQYIMESCVDWMIDVETRYMEAVIENNDLDMGIQKFADEFDIPGVDFNFDEACEYVGKIPVYLAGHSNFDCTNSFNNLESELEEGEGYLQDIYQRVESNISKDDFMYEHRNGAYGGSLFVFVMQMDVIDFINLRENWEDTGKIIVGKGTQYGFYSSFQGSASVFDKRLDTDLELKVKESKYDHWSLYFDGERGYGLSDIFGSFDWIRENYIKAKN